ncbi:TetR/AcrR family transcriptional regulator [Fusobacterium massiliense]|uniref:TetR/AcrR family transcriptional regulator n=1 Tax=Fusobacterium massiliense TaxID=1852365 RepID=UPI00093C1594|nr:TetR/AcrR family transcriptional regulator [Fusobacterium massiliense]
MNKNIDKKHLILEKAKDMIISDGYGNISINKLTTELGISKGSFYTYFISKDEMLNEILEEYKRETIKFIEYVNEKTNSIQEFIENSLSYSSLFLAEENTLKLEIVMLNLKRNYEILNEETFKKMKEIVHSIMDNIRANLLKYINEIKIKREDIERCTKLLFSMMEFYLAMENIDFNQNKFSVKSLEEIKKSYQSKEMKDNIEFIKNRIIEILIKK